MQDYNRKIIDEFRANEGRVGGPFAGAPVVLVTSTGAKSGRPHTTPLVYLREEDGQGGPGDRIYVFGSMGGAPKHPAWYHNLKAHPEATVEVGTEKYPVRAVVIPAPSATGSSRNRRRYAPSSPSTNPGRRGRSRSWPWSAWRKPGPPAPGLPLFHTQTEAESDLQEANVTGAGRPMRALPFAAL